MLEKFSFLIFCTFIFDEVNDHHSKLSKNLDVVFSDDRIDSFPSNSKLAGTLDDEQQRNIDRIKCIAFRKAPDAAFIDRQWIADKVHRTT